MSQQRLEEAYRARSKKLNKVENTKALKDPMEVYEKLDEIAKGGYEKLDKEDSAYFLKCFGLFDKGEDFMLRVRIPGGQLSNEQAIRIASLAKAYGDDYIDLTTRMQVELRYLKIENIATVLHALQEVGISTFQTGVDNPRNIVTDPLDGLAYDNLIESMPILKKLQAIFLENPKWISALPRKFNTAILGSLSNSCNIFGHDCSFVLANKDGNFGFNLYLGARVGVQGKDADLFVTPEQTPVVYEAILKSFQRFGYRDNRNKNRLHFLLQDVGVDAFVQALKEEAGVAFDRAGVTLVQSQNIALGSNRVLLKNGTYAYKIIVPSGIFSGSDLLQAAKIAQAYGNGDLRIGYDQNLYIVNIAPEKFSDFEKESLIQKYAQYNNLYFSDMIACAGTKTCSYAVIPNKPDAIEMAHYLNDEVAIPNAQVRMNWSACPKGCGVHGIADIGFEGCKAKDSEGNRVDGVHLFLGGKITREAREAYTLHKALPLSDAKHHVKYLLKLYADKKERTESFEAFEDRYLKANFSYQAIAFFTMINTILNDKSEVGYYFDLDKELKTYKNEAYEIFYFGLKLFRGLTGEKRFDAVDGLTPIKSNPKKIKPDTVTKLNPKVPPIVSDVIYRMTHENKQDRAQVFSELMVDLKRI